MVLAASPNGLPEAGRIDGASEGWLSFRVAMPLPTGPLSALGNFALLQACNQFAWPLLVANSKNRYTAEVGLALFQTGYTVNFGAVTAGSVNSVLPIPIVFLALRRRIIDGVALSGLQG
jgi:multiple sugar transport system permease protein